MLRVSSIFKYLLPLHRAHNNASLFLKPTLFANPTRHASSDVDVDADATAEEGLGDDEEEVAGGTHFKDDSDKSTKMYDQKVLDEQLAQLSFTVKDTRIFHDDFILNQAAKANALHAEKARRRQMKEDEEVDPEEWEEMDEDILDAASAEEQEIDTASKKITVDDWWREYLKQKEGVALSVGDRINRLKRFSGDVITRTQAQEAGDATSPYDREADFVINEVIQLGFHTKLTVGGRINSHSALVLIGTGKGTAGFGYGKGATAADATERAFKDAERNLVSVSLYHGGLPNSMMCRCRRSFVKFTAYSHRTHSGAANHPVMQTIANAFGINNVNIRSYKRRTWHNMLEAIMKTLPQTIHPEEMARRQGKKYKDADILGRKPIRPKLL